MNVHSEPQRELAHRWVDKMPLGWILEVREPGRNNDQNAAFHTAVRDVQKQVEWHGKHWTEEAWKQYFLTSLVIMHQMLPEVMPHETSAPVLIHPASSKLTKGEMSDLIELVYEFGARHGVTFTAPRSVTPNTD